MSDEAAERSAKLQAAIRKDGRYPLEAFEFLHAGLEEAARRVHGEEGGEEPRHVTGQQLCEALRDLAIQRWGRMAPAVLSSWSIHRTRDFGEMVFLLVKLGMMGRQESDDISDFEDVYDFRGAFRSYRIPLDRLEG